MRAPVAGFVLPLGTTMNMTGTALYEGCVVLFIAQVFGIELGIAQQVTLVLLAVLSAVAVAAIPGGSLPLVAGLLVAFGIPPEGIGIILGVERILDMTRTMVNVGSDVVTTVVVDRLTKLDGQPVRRHSPAVAVIRGGLGPVLRFSWLPLRGSSVPLRSNRADRSSSTPANGARSLLWRYGARLPGRLSGARIERVPTRNPPRPRRPFHRAAAVCGSATGGAMSNLRLGQAHDPLRPLPALRLHRASRADKNPRRSTSASTPAISTRRPSRRRACAGSTAPGPGNTWIEGDDKHEKVAGRRGGR